ncbi:hypothetical protein RB200_37560 [Streptomyces sp. PmtG]
MSTARRSRRRSSHAHRPVSAATGGMPTAVTSRASAASGQTMLATKPTPPRSPPARQPTASCQAWACAAVAYRRRDHQAVSRNPSPMGSVSRPMPMGSRQSSAGDALVSSAVVPNRTVRISPRQYVSDTRSPARTTSYSLEPDMCTRRTRPSPRSTTRSQWSTLPAAGLLPGARDGR